MGTLRLKKLYYGRIDSPIVSKLEQCREYVRLARAEVEAVLLDLLDLAAFFNISM